MSQTWEQGAVQDRAVRSLVGVSRAAFKLRLLPLGPLHDLYAAMAMPEHVPLWFAL